MKAAVSLCPPAKAALHTDTNRVDWVDIAKGICIIFVVMMHTTLGVEAYVMENGLAVAGNGRGWMHEIVEFARPFRMPDFFLISGLFLVMVIDRPWRLYLDRKVLHFAYFYVLWVIIQFGFKGGWAMLDGTPPAEIAGQFLLTFIQPFGTLWFIYLLPVMFVVTKALKRLPWQAVLGVAALLHIAPVHTGWVTVDEFASRYVFFLSGYLFATRIFDLGAWARERKLLSLALLAMWALINGFLVKAGFSGWPIVSLILGIAGAGAIILSASLIARLRVLRPAIVEPLRALGNRSIVVYLAFFFPMIVSRLALFKLAPWMDIGTMSLIGTIAGVVLPMVLYALIKWTGWGTFLFHRPQWAMLREGRAHDGRSKVAPVMVPAE